jgi:RsiW-degrading membrane proteinase PrsW (M82 family)
MAKRPGGVMVQEAEATRSQLIPVLTKWEEIGKKAQLGPAIFCIAAFFAMQIWGSTDTIIIPLEGAKGLIDPLYWIYTSQYLILLAILLTTASLYFIYRIVGKNKSWWVLFAAMAFCAYFLWLTTVRGYFGWLYDFFHQDLAGGEPDERGPFLQLFIRHFLGTGFFEEFVKGIPVLLLAYLGKYMSPAVRSKFGVEEPLDGILVGAASGGGFAIVESLVQYIPEHLSKIFLNVGLLMHGISGDKIKPFLASLNAEQYIGLFKDGSDFLGTAYGIPPLIIRSIDLAFGHMAYSGYFGYFIGLSILKPQQRWKILAIGLVSASLPHALWDSVASLDMDPLQAACAILAYAVLAAAILKAREISPNRSFLQPSVIFGASAPGAGGAVAMGGMRVATPVRVEPIRVEPIQESPRYGAPEPAQLSEPAVGSNRLRVGTKSLVILPGLRLLDHQVPGLSSQAPGGVIAEVTRNPNDPSILGLTNQSTGVWETVTGSGVRRTIGPGQTIKLARGTRIDFGSVDGEVI